MTAKVWRTSIGALRLCIGVALVVAGLGLVSVGRAGVDAHLSMPAGRPDERARVSPEIDGPPPLAEPRPAVELELGPGGRDIRLSGELTDGVAARLARLLKANPGVERIHLTSEGGLVDEGEAIGEAIAARHLVTFVPDYCVSACTLAFVRGRERLILPGSRLGFHAPYETDGFGRDVQTDSAPERAAYIAAGIAAEFVDVALGVSSDDLWIPGADKLLSAGVATALVDERRFSASALDNGADLDPARQPSPAPSRTASLVR